MSMPRPVKTIVPRKASSASANRGVKSRVSTGAMFSITLCFASTSQEATITAPSTPHGTPILEHRLEIDPDRPEHPGREPEENPAAQRNQRIVDEQLAGEADEVHAPGGLPPAPARVCDPHKQPQRDRQVQRRQHLRVGCRLEGIDIREEGRGCESARQPHPGTLGKPPLPDEVAGEEGKDEEAEVARSRTSGPPPRPPFQPEQLRQLDRQRGRRRRARRRRSSRCAPRPPTAPCRWRTMTSCFHSRSECSRANSFEIASSAPIRFTATRNASFSERPAPRSAATSPRR